MLMCQGILGVDLIGDVKGKRRKKQEERNNDNNKKKEGGSGHISVRLINRAATDKGAKEGLYYGTIRYDTIQGNILLLKDDVV